MDSNASRKWDGSHRKQEVVWITPQAGRRMDSNASRKCDGSHRKQEVGSDSNVGGIKNGWKNGGRRMNSNASKKLDGFDLKAEGRIPP